jgi:cytochrome b561
MVCWRCQTPLPKPKPPQPKRRMSYMTLSWLIVALFLIGWLFFQLFILNPVGR